MPIFKFLLFFFFFTFAELDDISECLDNGSTSWGCRMINRSIPTWKKRTWAWDGWMETLSQVEMVHGSFFDVDDQFPKRDDGLPRERCGRDPGVPRRCGGNLSDSRSGIGHHFTTGSIFPKGEGRIGYPSNVHGCGPSPFLTRFSGSAPIGAHTHRHFRVNNWSLVCILNCAAWRGLYTGYLPCASQSEPQPGPYGSGIQSSRALSAFDDDDVIFWFLFYF